MQKTSLLTIKDNQTSFIPYLVAGHTSNEVFSAALRLLSDVGADLIEIGISLIHLILINNISI